VPKVSAAHKEQVRQRLIDAASTVVMRDGHEGTTTRAILAEAGLSAGALYTYFSSKEELFEALAERALGESVFLYTAEAAPDATPADVLRRFVAELLLEPDLPALAWFRGRMSSDPEVQAAAARFNRYIVDTFVPIVEGARTLRAGIDVEAVVELFDILVEGLNKREVLGTFATTFQRVGAVAAALLVDAITEGAPPT
jgi:AcrR family transcriptional regulator